MSKQQVHSERNWYVIHTYAGYENAVMRNLLLDLLENEVAFPVQQATVSVDDLLRMKATKIQRYREILAESRHVLQQREASRVSGLSSSLKSTERRM